MAQQLDHRITIEIQGLNITKRKLMRQGDRTRRQIEEVIDMISFKIQREAALRAPVDTGFLRSSIIVIEEEPFYNEIVATADYAHFVEYGTRRTAAQPFMVPAAQMFVDEFRREIQKAMRWGWAI